MTAAFIIGFLTGILSGAGIGGGTLLVLYLTSFTDIGQKSAQGINLLYFLACTPPAIISHIKNGRADKRACIICAFCGCISAYFGFLLSKYADSSFLTNIFSFVFIIIGIKELFSKEKKTD